MHNKSLFVIQPSFLPWYGQFAMIMKSNNLILLDDVQYDSNGWRNRNRIQNLNSIIWITVPVLSKGRHGQLINEVEIDNRHNWKRDLINKLYHGYKKQPFFDEIFYRFECEIKVDENSLLSLNLRLLRTAFECLDIQKEICLSSEISKTSSDPNERLINLCLKMRCNIYNSGQSAKNYLNVDIFNRHGIAVKWFDAVICNEISKIYPVYTEQLTILDLLFRLGTAESINFLNQYGRWE